MPSARLDLGGGRGESLIGRRWWRSTIRSSLAGVDAGVARRARAAARRARSEVFSPGAAIWRWRMPVRCTIHSSDGIDPLGQLVVGDDPLGQIAAAADDERADGHQRSRPALRRACGAGTSSRRVMPSRI